jgi:hypothetical protein
MSNYDINEGHRIREQVIQEAAKCVLRDRNATHGEPENNFRDIADLWTAYLGYEVNATQVACMMALMKIARLKHTSANRDSWVDLIGYAACGAGVALHSSRIGINGGNFSDLCEEAKQEMLAKKATENDSEYKLRRNIQ